MRFSIAALFAIAALALTIPLPAQNGRAPLGFDAPGAATVSSPQCAPDCGTIAFANNAEGAIVGYYTDADVVPHAFLRAPNGHIVPFDAPGAGLGTKLDQGTVAYSINDWGLIAGQFQDSSYIFHGFVRYPDGSFSTFEVQDAGTGAFQGTQAFDVNLEGTTAGIYVDGNNMQHGFVRSSYGEIKTFDPPGSLATMACEETCLNAEGAITGFFLDANNVFHGFIRDPEGKITILDAPGAGKGADQGTFSGSINLEGTITGYYADTNGALHGFVRNGDGHYTEFNVATTPKERSQVLARFQSTCSAWSRENSSTRLVQCMGFPGCLVGTSQHSMPKARVREPVRAPALRPTT